MRTNNSKSFSPVAVPAQGLEYRRIPISLRPAIHSNSISDVLTYTSSVFIAPVVNMVQNKKHYLCKSTAGTFWYPFRGIMCKDFYSDLMSRLSLVVIPSAGRKGTLKSLGSFIPAVFTPLSEIFDTGLAIGYYIKVSQWLGSTTVAAKSHLWGVANPSNLYPSWSAHVADCRLNYLQLSSLFSLNLQEAV